MEQRINKNIWMLVLLVWLVFGLMAMTVYAKTYNEGDGSLANGLLTYNFEWNTTNGDSRYDTEEDVKDAVTGWAKTNETNSYQLDLSAAGHKRPGCSGTGSNLTVTVTNNSGKIALISADALENRAEIKFNNSVVEDGDVITLQPNGSFTISLSKSIPSGNRIEYNTDSVVFTVDIPMSVITAVPSPYCSYTVNGYEVAANATERYVLETEQGTTINLVATIPEGVNFLGWRIDGNEDIIPSASTSFVSTLETTLYPVFDTTVVSTEQNFKVDEQYFAYWEDAMQYAVSRSTSKLVVAIKESYTLPSLMEENGLTPLGGSYVIGADNNIEYIVPTGVTLLIPFDSDNTLYTTVPAHDDSATWIEPSAYRTLTLPANCSLTINGAVSLSAKHHAGQAHANAGVVTGPYGCIDMAQGSTITVNRGGALYAWGYITGEGTVSALSGATVYEYFSVQDFNDGGRSLTLNSNADSKRVFLFQNYYIQNIVVPITVYSGAQLRGYTTFYSYDAKLPFSSDIGFIGSDGSLFTLSSGNVVKRYDYETDRLILDINDAVSIHSISVTIKVDALGFPITQTMTSNDFDMPITANMTINVNNGGSVNTNVQSMVFIPGSELNIEEGGTFTVGSGQRLIAYDVDEWGNYAAGAKVRPLAYVPDREYTFGTSDLKDVEICVNGTLDASKGAFYTVEGNAKVYSTGNGVVKTAATSAITSYMFIRSSDEFVGCTANPAMLKNSDAHASTDPYTSTAAVADGGYGAGTYTYYAATGLWCPPGHRYDDGVVTTAATCTADGVKTYTCSACGGTSTETIPATGHSYSSVVTAPTCTEQGYTTYTCKNSGCTHSYIGDEVAALGHTPNDDDGDCTTPITCSVCGAETTAANAEHSWGDWVETTPPTSTDAGEETRTCSVCGTTETQEIPATGGGEEEIISVTITWGSMNFVYTKGEWNPETHTYTVGSITPKTTGANVITVTNNSTVSYSLCATFSYTNNTGYSLTAVFTDTSGTALTNNKLTLPANNTTAQKVNLALTTANHITAAGSVDVGTVTVAISTE